MDANLALPQDAQKSGSTTMSHSLETLLDGLAFPEGPRWHDGRLWFSDMHAHEIVALDMAGQRETMLSWNAPVSGLGWLPDSRLLFVSMEDRKLMRREVDGTVVVHGDLGAIATWHTNDMVVDASGRAYVGNFGFPLPLRGEPVAAKLALITPDGSVSVASDDLMFPNGMVITPDGRTLIVGESFAGRLTAFDIGPEGQLTDRRVWAQLDGGAVPDGICLDAEGAIWVASPSTGEVLRVHEGGAISGRIATGEQAIACMLGGPDKKHLFVLISASTDPEICAATRTARIAVTQVEVAGAGWP
jgi:sugar lactone lactonase YvrE